MDKPTHHAALPTLTTELSIPLPFKASTKSWLFRKKISIEDNNCGRGISTVELQREGKASGIFLKSALKIPLIVEF